MKIRTVALAIASLAATSPLAALAQTTASIGIDYAEGKYGTTDKTTTVSIPVSIKHEAGSWTFKASIPLTTTQGTFSRESGVPADCLRRSNTEIDDECVAAASGSSTGTNRESGLGDLTLGAFYNILETKSGLLVDVGAKAKIATADKAKTLITNGENDYSVQVDLMQSVGKTVSIFASLGYTKRGDSPTVDYSDPLYGSLGASIAVGAGGSVGAAWDFREKVVKNGDPISEVSVFYSMKLGNDRKFQVYALTGLSDGSPDVGGGLVFSQRF
jgi:hypothetical protein